MDDLKQMSDEALAIYASWACSCYAFKIAEEVTAEMWRRREEREKSRS